MNQLLDLESGGALNHVGPVRAKEALVLFDYCDNDSDVEVACGVFFPADDAEGVAFDLLEGEEEESVP